MLDLEHYSRIQITLTTEDWWRQAHADKTLYVKLDSGHLPYAAFPNAGLEGDQMILLDGIRSIVS